MSDITDLALHELYRVEQDAITYCQQVAEELGRREKRIAELASERDVWRERHHRLGTLSWLLVCVSLAVGWVVRGMVK